MEEGSAQDACDEDLAFEARLDQQLQRLLAANSFTPAQCRVLGLLVTGLSNKEIALALDITEATTEAHVTQLFRKSGVENRTALATAFWTCQTPRVTRAARGR